MSPMDKKRVLIVDDEKSLVRLLKLNLESTGLFDVEVESRGSEACEKALRFKPDVILMDIVMPEISGDRIAAQMRANPSLCHVPIIFLTATISREEAKRCQQLFRGQLFLAKPATVPEVIDALHSALSLNPKKEVSGAKTNFGR